MLRSVFVDHAAPAGHPERRPGRQAAGGQWFLGVSMCRGWYVIDGYAMILIYVVLIFRIEVLGRWFRVFYLSLAVCFRRIDSAIPRADPAGKRWVGGGFGVSMCRRRYELNIGDGGRQ